MDSGLNDIVLSIPLQNRVYVLAGLVLVDLALGIAVAIRACVFDWEKLPQFLWTGLTKKVLAYAATHYLFMHQDILPVLGRTINSTALAATFGMVVIALVTSIKRKTTKLL